MKYFVIGGAGFVGSSLVSRLLKDKKNYVTVYDNLSSGKLEYISELKYTGNLKFVKGDILNFKKLQEKMKNHDFVFHFAANPDIRLGMKKPRLDFEINVVGTLNVLDSIVKNKIKFLCFTSSSAVFGIPEIFPTPEHYGPCIPESLYGASKLACEGYVSAYSKIHNIKSWIIRPANITGYPATHGIIYDFYKKIKKNHETLEVLGNGKQRKSYITNNELVEGILFLIKKTIKKKDNVLLFNMGNKDSISVREIADFFINKNNLNIKPTFTGGVGGWKGDVPVMNLDITKLSKIGWNPQKSSNESIIESIEKNSDLK